MADVGLGRLRRICLTLPEAVEKETWDHPDLSHPRQDFRHGA